MATKKQTTAKKASPKKTNSTRVGTKYRTKKTVPPQPTDGTYTKAVDRFLKKADWLGDEDAPMVEGLKELAKELDAGFMAATYHQYGMTYRFLMKRKSQGEGAPDPLEAILDED